VQPDAPSRKVEHILSRGFGGGVAELRRCIAEAKRTNAKELNMGGLGLVQVPEELFELGQL
jgi:hypothetical protein